MWKKIIQAAIIAGGLSFVALYLYGQVGAVEGFEWRFDYPMLAASFILFVLYFVLCGVVWGRAVKRLGGALPQRKAVGIYMISSLGNYIPGKAWGVVGRIYMCRKEGIAKAKTSLSIAIEIIGSLTAGLLVFFASAAFWPDLKGLESIAVLLLLIPAGLVLLHPSVYRRAIRLASKKMDAAGMEKDLRYRDMLYFLAAYCVLWVMYGISMIILINSFYDFGFGLTPVVVGIFSVSWVMGFLSFITPSGIGVREGVTSFLLSFFMPVSAAVLIALVARILYTLSEAASASAVLLFLRLKR